jgi:hypothetical protein
VCKEGEGGNYKLIPIDHGYCLPEKVIISLLHYVFGSFG